MVRDKTYGIFSSRQYSGKMSVVLTPHHSDVFSRFLCDTHSASRSEVFRRT